MSDVDSFARDIVDCFGRKTYENGADEKHLNVMYLRYFNALREYQEKFNIWIDELDYIYRFDFDDSYEIFIPIIDKLIKNKKNIPDKRKIWNMRSMNYSELKNDPKFNFYDYLVKSFDLNDYNECEDKDFVQLVENLRESWWSIPKLIEIIRGNKDIYNKIIDDGIAFYEKTFKKTHTINVDVVTSVFEYISEVMCGIPTPFRINYDRKILSDKFGPLPIEYQKLIYPLVNDDGIFELMDFFYAISNRVILTGIPIKNNTIVHDLDMCPYFFYWHDNFHIYYTRGLFEHIDHLESIYDDLMSLKESDEINEAIIFILWEYIHENVDIIFFTQSVKDCMSEVRKFLTSRANYHLKITKHMNKFLTKEKREIMVSYIGSYMESYMERYKIDYHYSDILIVSDYITVLICNMSSFRQYRIDNGLNI